MGCFFVYNDMYSLGSRRGLGKQMPLYLFIEVWNTPTRVHVGLLPWVLPPVVKKAAAYLLLVMDQRSCGSVRTQWVTEKKRWKKKGHNVPSDTLTCPHRNTSLQCGESWSYVVMLCYVTHHYGLKAHECCGLLIEMATLAGLQSLVWANKHLEIVGKKEMKWVTAVRRSNTVEGRRSRD